jgi:hypothetical protein
MWNYQEGDLALYKEAQVGEIESLRAAGDITTLSEDI